jgi:hypothetical protein
MNKAALIWLLISVLMVSCNSTQVEIPDGNVHTSKDGIISIEAEHFHTQKGWRERTHYTSVGISPDIDSLEIEDFAIYKILIEEPGNYNFYVLGNRRFNQSPSENFFQAELIFNDQSLAKHPVLFPNNTNATEWSSISKAESLPMKFHIQKKGLYTLKIKNIDGKGYYLDKMVLSKDPDFRPAGMGPLETMLGENPRELNSEVILPPQWAFGILYGGYTTQEETMAVIEKLINNNYPIDAYWIDSWFWDFNEGKGPNGYIDFVGDTTAYPDMQKMWNEMEKLSVKGGIWIWDLIQLTGNENAFNKYNNRDYFKATFTNYNGWHNQTKNTLTGVIDFENPEAVEEWKQDLKPFFDAGLDFLKLDNSSAIPFVKAAFEATQQLGKETQGRGFILSHLHSTYDSRYKLYPTKWTGDAKIAWTQTDYPNLWNYSMGGFKENIGMAADPKRTTYDIPFLTHDAGGYDYFGSEDQSDELYIRWIQFSAMNTLMTIFSTAKNPTRNHPYGYSEQAQDNFRKYTHLRMKLFPYIYSYAINTRLTGNKMVQGDGIHEYQYLFGNELLVAPVYKKGEVTRALYLPEGKWIDFETHETFTGGDYIKVDAPLDKLPMFVRAGSIIPMRNYSRTVETGSNDTIHVHVYPAPDVEAKFTLYEDDGVSNDYLNGKIASTTMIAVEDTNGLEVTIKPTEGEFQGMQPERQYYLHVFTNIKPQSVSVNGNPVKENSTPSSSSSGWEYDEYEGKVSLGIFTSKEITQTIKLRY